MLKLWDFDTTLMPLMRSARRASAQSSGCEARSAKQTVDTPHQRRQKQSEERAALFAVRV